MTYVHLLRSEKDPRQVYVGLTSDFDRRLAEHNAGKSVHTAKYMPWRGAVCLAFADKHRALEFEAYLKSGSGRAFANRHFW